jgi:hypothetical protein
MVQVTIDIPDDLAQRLQQFHAQLPQVLELGLQEFQSQQRQSKSHHYPLRGLPLETAEDFDEPMTDLWDELGS